MIIAVDIGATKTLVSRFTNGQPTGNPIRFATSPDQHQFLSDLLNHLHTLDLQDAQALAIAVPGLVSPDGTVIRCGVLPWADFSLQAELAKTISCPIFIENDANLGGLGEIQPLGDTPPLALYLTISTGIGSGIITHGQIDPALSKSEAGHMVIPTMDGPKVWQDFASGKSIKEHFHHLAVDIHEAEDWEEISYNLALGLEMLIPTLQPDVIILGGSIGKFFDKFAPPLNKLLQQRLPKYITLPPIKQATRPNEAVLYGCHAYALQRLAQPSQG